jgi:hypothetical protein
MRAQRDIQRKRVARSAAVSIWRDDRDLRERRQGARQTLQALGTIAVIVADKDSQA